MVLPVIQVYSMMMQCWAFNGEDRPSFSYLQDLIESSLQDEREGAKGWKAFHKESTAYINHVDVSESHTSVDWLSLTRWRVTDVFLAKFNNQMLCCSLYYSSPSSFLLLCSISSSSIHQPLNEIITLNINVKGKGRDGTDKRVNSPFSEMICNLQILHLLHYRRTKMFSANLNFY